jgi:predicted nucleic acid-binding protein
MKGDFVIDNSVVMTWCFKDERSQYADAVLDRLERSAAIVPTIWPLEVGNVLLVAERKKRLSEADSIRFMALLSELPLLIDQEPPERMLKEILSLAREHRISTYDSSYLDLAMKKGLPLATLDKGLRKAAKRSDVSILLVDEA